MELQFNTVLERANCHIRTIRRAPVVNEAPTSRPHKHYSMEFHCIMGGQEIIALPHEGLEIPLTSGNILLLPQNIYHGVYTKSTTVERICFNFSAEPVGKEPSPIVDLFMNIKEPVVFDDEDAAIFVEQCRKLFLHPQGQLPDLRQGMLFLNIALNLMSRVQNVQTDAHTADPLALQQRWIMEDYITQHYTDNSGIAGLAKALYLSQRQTSTLVKRFFGDDYKTIIIRRRMELAEIYLQNPDKPLDEIAYEVGYRSYSGFELCFKRYFGMTPTEKRTQICTERKRLL